PTRSGTWPGPTCRPAPRCGSSAATRWCCRWSRPDGSPFVLSAGVCAGVEGRPSTSLRHVQGERVGACMPARRARRSGIMPAPTQARFPMTRKTILNETHRALGAKMVDFGGWDMPIHYGSQIDEHHQVRRDAGMFDVSHMTV